MKIDFYAHKKFYGTHVMALLGFSHLKLSIFISGEPIFLMFLYPLFLAIYSIPAIFFIIDFSIKRTIKKTFFLRNILYDILVDIGLFCYIAPFYALFISFLPVYRLRNFTKMDFLPLLLLFVIFQVLKMYQSIKEKQQKS